ncbi:MAG: kelch repeat-containing protein [Ferruginibacter sp.]
MQKILVVALMLCGLSTKSQQVGINNATPDPSAVLDIKSSTKGMLIPRVNKTERGNIGSPAPGLMVYQTGPDSTGFYYFQNTWHYINYDSLLPPSSIVLSKTYPNASLKNNNFEYGGQINIPNATLTEFLPLATNIWTPIDSTVANYPPNGTVDPVCIWADSVFFLTGGYSSSNIGIPFYKYNINTGKWTMVNSTTLMPSSSAGARVGNKWIFWGGYAGGGAPYGSAFPAYIFDLNSYSLTQSAAIIDSARRFLTATNIGNSIYFWGGLNVLGPSYNYSTGYKYDAGNNTWSLMSPNGSPSPRYHAGAVAAGTDIVIWGGYSTSSGILKTGAIYRTASNTWTAMSLTNAPTSGTIEPAMAYYNNQVYIISANETKRFDPIANTWTTLSPPPFSYNGQKFTYDGNGKIYVWGGARYFFTGVPTNNGYVYNLANDTYSTITTSNAPISRAGHTLCFGNNAFIIWGGSTSTGANPSTAESLKNGGIFYFNAQNVFVTQPLAPIYMYEKK